jgi:Domain of unknown function (DUF4333)
VPAIVPSMRPHLVVPKNGRSPRPRRYASAALAVLACGALLSACGSSKSSSTSSTSAKATVNTVRVAESIKASILSQRHLTSTVVCPSTVHAEVGATFTCVATTKETKKPHKAVTTPFVVTIQNASGYVTYVGK